MQSPKHLPLHIARDHAAIGWLALCYTLGLEEDLAIRTWPGIKRQVNASAQALRYHLAAMPLARNGSRRHAVMAFYRGVSPKLVVELLENGARAQFVSLADANRVIEALLREGNRCGEWRDYSRWEQTEMFEQARAK